MAVYLCMAYMLMLVLMNLSMTLKMFVRLVPLVNVGFFSLKRKSIVS